jgi:hypothetical protein
VKRCIIYLQAFSDFGLIMSTYENMRRPTMPSARLRCRVQALLVLQAEMLCLTNVKYYAEHPSTPLQKGSYTKWYS